MTTTEFKAKLLDWTAPAILGAVCGYFANYALFKNTLKEEILHYQVVDGGSIELEGEKYHSSVVVLQNVGNVGLKDVSSRFECDGPIVSVRATPTYNAPSLDQITVQPSSPWIRIPTFHMPREGSVTFTIVSKGKIKEDTTVIDTPEVKATKKEKVGEKDDTYVGLFILSLLIIFALWAKIKSYKDAILTLDDASRRKVHEELNPSSRSEASEKSS